MRYKALQKLVAAKLGITKLSTVPYILVVSVANIWGTIDKQVSCVLQSQASGALCNSLTENN